MSAVVAGRRTLHVAAFAPDHNATTTKIKFSVRHSVKYGQKVAVVGAPPALGEWNVEKAVELTWGEGDEWQAQSAVPAGPLEMKFVVVDGARHVKWSPGPNIVIEVPPNAAEVEVVASGWAEGVQAKVVAASAPIAPAAASNEAAAPRDAPAAPTRAATTPSSKAATAAAVADFLSSKPAAASAAAVDASKLATLTVPQLKALALEMKLPTQGKKAELVARLKAALQST